jgi:hypothetical protein
MTTEDILNIKCLPKSNGQIQKASPKRIAQTIAYHFLFSNIALMEREFDNLWENGRTEDIKKEFSSLFIEIPDLSYNCLHKYPNNQYFSEEMLNKEAQSKVSWRVQEYDGEIF